MVLGYALRRCANPSDAADVAADVFLTAWRRLDDLPRDEPLPWLIGTARGAVANQRRGQLRRHRLADRLRDDLLVNPPVSQAHPDLAPVTAAMERLSRSDRELLRLVAWEGLTPIQIAALDDVPASTVRSRLRRARTRLASALAAERNRPARTPQPWRPIRPPLRPGPQPPPRPSHPPRGHQMNDADIDRAVAMVDPLDTWHAGLSASAPAAVQLREAIIGASTTAVSDRQAEDEVVLVGTIPAVGDR